MVSASIEVLSDFVIHKILDKPFDQVSWTRKVFKVYKMLNILEKRATQPKLYYKRLFKLVFVLFRLEKGKNVDEIWRDISMTKANSNYSTDMHLLDGGVSSIGPVEDDGGS